MLFNSLEFLFFLPLTFLLYWFVFKQPRHQNLFIVVASYIFYGWWDWRFLILIVVTSVCSYLSGYLIGINEGNHRKKKLISALNILLNLTILGVFKYFNFFADSLEALLLLLGYHIDKVTLNVVLPVGISFYTFQALSYSIDVYRGQIKPTSNIIAFFAYISFFPQLVAGPIERATNLLPQFLKKRQFNYGCAVDGMRQMLWGFLKKLAIADNCAYVVNSYWNAYNDLCGFSLLFLGLLFSIQIYCDFSGYSDIAIGCARLFGFNLKRNFNYPYFSKSIPEFWRRWHMSLMSWFKDYVYIPLGGSRCSRWRSFMNIMIVFLLSGLWHGANWTFVIWGGYNALLIIVSNIVGWNGKDDKSPQTGIGLIRSIKTPMTFMLVILGWMIFRAESMDQIGHIFNSIISNNFFNATQVVGKKYALMALAMFLVEWIQRKNEHALQLPNNKIFRYRCTRWTLYVLLYLFIMTSMGQSQTFIYFQF